MKFIAAAYLALSLLLNAMPRPPQASDLEAEASTKRELTERRGVMIPMRDGVRLAADIYLPRTTEPLPVILKITPYGRSTRPIPAQARSFAQHDYVVVVADSRGRYDSEGTWDPFSSKHKADGTDLVEWLARQSWSTGKIGMMGDSYEAWTQWWTASTAPPHLQAIVPAWAPADQFQGGPYQDGALYGWIATWAVAVSGRVNQMFAVSDAWKKRRLEDLGRTPYKDINVLRGIENMPWFPTWYLQNKSTDPYWSEIAYQGKAHYSRVTVPTLNVTGWFDGVHAGTPSNYIGMKMLGATPSARRPRLIIGPWVHGVIDRSARGIDYGPQAKFNLDGYTMRWFDHLLKGIDNGIEAEPPIQLFVMGRNEWRTAEDWPLPETEFTKFFLTSQGHANSLKGDGSLTTERPPRGGSDTYVYDPRNPTLDATATQPTPWGPGAVDGAVDTRLSSMGDDVLVYQTPPLESAVEVIGPIEATLYASTSAKDTDWMVRLVDVHPDGRALLLADGVLRARNRDPQNAGQFNGAQLSTIEPGQVYQYTIRFWRGTANVFLPRHRIRIEVSSSWFPIFLPNLNTGADNLAVIPMSKAVVAQQKILHGPQFPSHILLPVIPASSLLSNNRTMSRLSTAQSR